MPEQPDPTTRLEALGRAEPPPPSSSLVAGLTAARLVRPEPAPPRPVRRLSVLVPAAAIAAAVLGFVLVALGGDDGRSLVVREAVNAFVETDGGRRPLRPGEELADGDRVVTGASGSLTAGEVTLGPNAEAVTRGNELRRVPVHTTTTTTTTTAPARPPTSSPAPTRPVETRPTTTAPPVAPSPSTSQTTSTTSMPASVRLAATRRRDGAVDLRWSRYEGADFGGYVVERQDGSVVFRTRDVETLGAVDGAAPPTATSYALVVVDAAGRPVARSEPATVPGR